MAAAMLVAGIGGGAGAATSDTATLGASVASATNLSVTACAAGDPGRTDLGLVPVGTSVIASDPCTIVFGSSNDTATLLASQGDGGGSAMWRTAPATLDATFDGPSGTGDGYAFIDTGAGDQQVWDVAVQRDGKVVVVGARNDRMLLVRLLPDGTLDPTFDGPGGSGDGLFELDAGGGEPTWAHAVAIQPDGKVVVAGDHDPALADTDAIVVRLDADGDWDATFDDDGIATVDVGSDSPDQVRGLALAADGDIVVGGVTTLATDDLFVARLDADGDLDAAFGVRTVDGGGTEEGVPAGASSGYSGDVAVDSQDRVVVVGNVEVGGQQDLLAMRLTSTGAPDPAFNGGAPVLHELGGDDDVDGMAIDAQDRIVVAAGDGVTRVARLVDGALDATFDGPSGTGDGIVQLATGGDGAWPHDLAIRADGMIVVAGDIMNPVDAFVAVLDEAGVADASFDDPAGGGDGIIRMDDPLADNWARGVDLGIDGGIVTAGVSTRNANHDLGVARLGTVAIDDYDYGVSDWDDGPSTFAACMAGFGAGTTPIWGDDPDTCTADDDDPWNAIGAAPDPVAQTSAANFAGASVDLHFGVRMALDQAPGRYLAPVAFTVVAPSP